MEPESLAKLYSSKSDDELLALAGDTDSLVENARLILATEIRRRNIIVPPPDVQSHTATSQNTVARHAAFPAVGKFFRGAGEFLLNYVLAVFGTTMMESSFQSYFGHAHSVSGIL